MGLGKALLHNKVFENVVMTSAWIFFRLPENHIDNFPITCKNTKDKSIHLFISHLQSVYVVCQ